jgi:hypothetical protein
MLPCNVIVQEQEDGIVELSTVDSVASMVCVQNSFLASIATEVREKLNRVMNKL